MITTIDYILCFGSNLLAITLFVIWCTILCKKSKEKEVIRLAKPNEWIKIVKIYEPDIEVGIKVGNIYKVESCIYDDSDKNNQLKLTIIFIDNHGDVDHYWCLTQDQYIVLENYKPMDEYLGGF